MPLRMVEVTVPLEALDEIAGIVEGIEIVHQRSFETRQHDGVVHFLLDAHDTEALSDLLASRYGKHDSFRLVSLAVEATLPALQQTEEEDPAEVGNTKALRIGPKRISREELYEDISQAAGLTPVYVVMVALSTVVAAVGLLRGDIAIIIGAMVIAPLLGPNIGLSLSATLGDTDLGWRSLKAVLAGVMTAGALSLAIGLLFQVDPTATQLASRSGAGISDVVLALAAGVAGSLAFTSGVPAIVVGVMVAVALLPPLVAAGLLAGAGHGHQALGAAMLALANVTCINLAAISTFIAQKVSPRTFWDSDRAAKATRRAATAWAAILFILLILIWFGDRGWSSL